MFPKAEAGKKIGEGSGNVKLLNEIETISKALYLDKSPSKNSSLKPNARTNSSDKARFSESRSKRLGYEEPPFKDKKSIWNWKPLKAFSNAKNRRFNCCFSLQVLSVRGLPPNFNDLRLCVYWKRRDEGLVTRLAKVIDGIAEFEDKLMHTCSVYAARSGPHHSAKYEAKHFLLYASVFEVPELDLGKHRVDLTRLLPLTLEELQGEKSSGKWTTSFNLSGKAKGAIMNVSFGYTLVGDNSAPVGSSQSVSDMPFLKQNSLRTGKPVAKTDNDDEKCAIRRVESLPNLVKQQSHPSSLPAEDVKDLHEVLPSSSSQLATSVNILYQKLNEDKVDASVGCNAQIDLLTEDHEPVKLESYPLPEPHQESNKSEIRDNDFSVVDQGIKSPETEHTRPENVTIVSHDVPQVEGPQVGFEIEPYLESIPEEGTQVHTPTEENESNRDVLVALDSNLKEDNQCTKELLMKELELALDSISNLETALESPEDKVDHMDVNENNEMIQIKKSYSLDDVTESVASEFLDMLGIEHSPFGLSSESEPESPRERLLRQFEKETLANGCLLFDFDVADGEQPECSYDAPATPGWGGLSENFDLSSVIQAAEEEHQMAAHGASKTRAKILEDLEAETLMREWGLNERAFQSSPPDNTGGFGSPLDLPPEEPLDLPPLGEGLGPFLQTKSGGYLRSMNPSLFQNAKMGGSLIMQVSNPVVVPAEMGSNIMEILQQLASVGIEKLSVQANKLMPLEDITGKTMQQVAWEAAPNLVGPDRQYVSQHEFEIGKDAINMQRKAEEISSRPRPSKSSSSVNQMGSEYVSLEDLAPLAMDKIEALSMEGLRIQSGLSDEDAPSNISARSIGEISTLQGKGFGISGSLGLEGTAGLQLLDVKDSDGDVDGIMGLSLTLDEWMRLDSGEFDDEDEISERTSKILAAHRATSLDIFHGRSKGEKKRGRKCGLLGNNFTVGLMVQLRDPLRNYEPVGAPMLALIQVERVFIPPKPKIYCKVSELRSTSEEDDESETSMKEEVKEEMKEEQVSQEEGIPQFRITEVHVAGMKTEPGKKKLWGSTTQQQSGSRWLLANGMGKSSKHPFMKSKTVSKSSTPSTTKVQPGDTLWSISSRIHGTGAKWKELAALNPHIRNPNVIFPNETIKLR